MDIFNEFASSPIQSSAPVYLDPALSDAFPQDGVASTSGEV
jgi:hypothetical protein